MVAVLKTCSTFTRGEYNRLDGETVKLARGYWLLIDNKIVIIMYIIHVHVTVTQMTRDFQHTYHTYTTEYKHDSTYIHLQTVGVYN